jgi:hypothetical protein
VIEIEKNVYFDLLMVVFASLGVQSLVTIESARELF